MSGQQALEQMSPRKREIITSIASAFAARGYHAVGMRELAQELGLNQGTLYHHFPSKDHALLAICLVGQHETHNNVAQTLASEAGFQRRVEKLFEAHLSSLDRLGDFIDVFASQRDAVPVALAEPLREGWLETRRLFIRLFDEAIAARDIAPDTDTQNARRLLLAIYRSANILHRTNRQDQTGPFVSTAMQIMLHGLVAHSPVSGRSS